MITVGFSQQQLWWSNNARLKCEMAEVLLKFDGKTKKSW